MSAPFRTPEELLKEYGELVRPISGVSMLPLLRQDKDAVRLVPVKRELLPGDVPLYKRNNGTYVLHRIASVKGNKYIIRGDNCTGFETVKKKQIVAVADGYYRDGTFVAHDDPKYQEYVADVLKRGEPFYPAEWYYICKLYSCAIKGVTPPDPPEDINWKSILEICKRQSISAAVSLSVSKLGDKVPKEISLAFDTSFAVALKRQAMFDMERPEILSEFEKQGIKYLPLKGIILNNYYPIYGMREFADNDILYDTSRRSDMLALMEKLGFEPRSLSEVHDAFKKPPFFNIEMHKVLFDDNKRFSSYYSDPWSFAVKDQDNAFGYHFKDEDFYVHFIAHYAKHYEHGGMGLRAYADLYLLRQTLLAKECFDSEYVRKQLHKAGLLDFERERVKLSQELIENGTLPDNELRISLIGNAYGSLEHNVEIEVGKKGKVRFLLGKLFPPRSFMMKIYPILAKLPVVLPVFWIVRLVSYTFDKKMLKRALLTFKYIKKNKKK